MVRCSSGTPTRANGIRWRCMAPQAGNTSPSELAKRDMKNILFQVTLFLAVAASVFGQTATVTVNTSTKVTQPPVGLLTLDGAASFMITRGTGSPNGVVTAAAGSLYLDLTGQLWEKSTGTGNTGWTQFPLSAPPATAGGSNTQIQYNSSGAFAGSPNLIWDGTNFVVGGPIRINDASLARLQFGITGGTANARNWLSSSDGPSWYFIATNDAVNVEQARPLQFNRSGDVTVGRNLSSTSGALLGNGAVPVGGTTGQVLSKSANSDYALGWTTIVSGGGGISAVGNLPPIFTTSIT